MNIDAILQRHISTNASPVHIMEHLSLAACQELERQATDWIAQSDDISLLQLMGKILVTSAPTNYHIIRQPYEEQLMAKFLVVGSDLLELNRLIFHIMQSAKPDQRDFDQIRHVNSNWAISRAVLISRHPISPNQKRNFNSLASYEFRHHTTNVQLLQPADLVRAMMQHRVGAKTTTFELHEFDLS